jgi:hypothetical protein
MIPEKIISPRLLFILLVKLKQKFHLLKQFVNQRKIFLAQNQIFLPIESTNNKLLFINKQILM